MTDQELLWQILRNAAQLSQSKNWSPTKRFWAGVFLETFSTDVYEKYRSAK